MITTHISPPSIDRPVVHAWLMRCCCCCVRTCFCVACSHVMLGEFNCTGPGSEATKREPWSRQLTQEEADKFINIDFINGKEWLPAYYY